MKAAILNTSNEVTNMAVVADESFATEQGWIVSEVARIGDTYDPVSDDFTTPPAPPYVPPFGTLKTDAWEIPANSTTVATVTYTSDTTVFFSVNETLHTVEPVDYIATLEITADAPGTIRVEVKDKQLVIAATEVVA